MPEGSFRGAAWIAGLAALPVAVTTGLLVFRALTGPVVLGEPDRPARAPATGAVTVSAPSLSAGQATLCRSLLRRLPPALVDQQRRPVSSGAEQAAAYGDPAVTVVCGATGSAVPPDGIVWVLSGVCWYAETTGDVTSWTTVDRQVPVLVRIPAAYPGQGSLLQDLTGPVATTVPLSPTKPPGCETR